MAWPNTRRKPGKSILAAFKKTWTHGLDLQVRAVTKGQNPNLAERTAGPIKEFLVQRICPVCSPPVRNRTRPQSDWRLSGCRLQTSESGQTDSTDPYLGAVSCNRRGHQKAEVQRRCEGFCGPR